MKKSIKWILIVVGILAVAAVVVGFVTKGTFKAQTSTTANTTTSETVKVTKGSLTVTITSTGSVRPAQSAVLNWQVAGKVGKIDVKVGQKVNQNDELASIDLTSLPQSLIQAQNDLITAQQALTDLQNGAATNETTALQTLAAAQTELANATTARASLKYARASQDTISASQAQLAVDQAKLDTVTTSYNNVKDRPADDFLRLQALSDMVAARQTVDKDTANLNWLLSGPDQNEIASADARLQVAKTKLADAQREVDRWKNGPSQDDITLAQNKIVIAQAAVNEAKILAPFSGTITDITSLPGDMVTATTEAMRIDDLTSQYVDMQVTEIDVNKLQVGQPVVVTFDAIPSKSYNGKITQVGQAGTTTSGIVYYDITAQLTNADQQVKAGMTASTQITISKTDNALLVPSRSIRTVGQRHMVYKPGDKGTPTPVFVQVGEASDVSTIITSGLNVGDVILANPPALGSGAGANRGLGGIFGGGGGGAPAGGGGGAPAGGGGAPAGGNTGAGAPATK